MKKNSIILNVRRHYGEIDWILPLLYRMSNRHKVFTIFDNKKVFQNFKKNKILFNIKIFFLL